MINLKVSHEQLSRWMERERYLTHQTKDTVKRLMAFAQVHPNAPIQLSEEDGIMIDELVGLRKMIPQCCPDSIYQKMKGWVYAQ